MKKFALHPGYVISDYDGEKHYVSAHKLAEILGLNPNEYIVWDIMRVETFRGRNWDDYIHLFPSDDIEDYNEIIFYIRKLKKLDKIKKFIKYLETPWNSIYFNRKLIRLKDDGKFYIGNEEIKPLNDLIDFIDKNYK